MSQEGHEGDRRKTANLFGRAGAYRPGSSAKDRPGRHGPAMYALWGARFFVVISASIIACGCGSVNTVAKAPSNLPPAVAEADPSIPLGLYGYTEIYIRAGNWWLGIRPDGHGGFGMGTDSYYSAAFGPGTFDFNALIQKLGTVRLLDTPSDDCTVRLIKPDWQEDEYQSVDDRALVISLFYTAYAASKAEPTSLIANAWAEHAPTTVPAE